MSHYKIQAVVDNWVRCRKSTVDSLRRCANTLESSHKENADAEHTSAKVSLTGGLILSYISGCLRNTYIIFYSKFANDHVFFSALLLCICNKCENWLKGIKYN
jgi:hypothetical protein